MPRPDRADVPDSQASREGYLYCLVHPMMNRAGQTLVKVGATRKHPIQRATELSAGTGVPGQFTVAYWVHCSDCFRVESACHDRFADARVEEAREFFAVTVDEVVGHVRGLLGDWIKEGGEWIESAAHRQAPVGESYPFAVLFASFPDDGEGRGLTDEEQAKCQELWRKQ